MWLEVMASTPLQWWALGLAAGLVLALALRVFEQFWHRASRPVTGLRQAVTRVEPTLASDVTPLEGAEEARIRHALDDALATGRPFFSVMLQPQVSLVDRQVTGVEALMRWDAGPPLGSVSPAHFIPVAERSGAILRLDMLMFETCVARFARLPPSVRRRLTLSVNFSIFHFLDLGFPETVLTICRRHDVAPTCVELEVTEHSAPEYLEPVRRTMGALRSNGFGIALDDFGAGFTSLRFLQTLPFSKVKLDASFVTQVDEGLRGRQLVGSLVRLADALELSMVAEGVERPGQAEQLQRLGCPVGQGYLLAPPVPDDRFYAWATHQLRSQYQPEDLDELHCKLAPWAQRGYGEYQQNAQQRAEQEDADGRDDRQASVP